MAALILGSSGAGFTGPLNINGGFVQVLAADSLPTTGTGITTIGTATVATTLDLNGVSNIAGTIIANGAGYGTDATITTGNSLTPATIYNSSAMPASLAAASTVSINALINAKAPTVGGWGDINILGTVQDGTTVGTAWSKVGPDVLTLSGNNTFTGNFTVATGVVRLGSPTGLGITTNATTAFTTVAAGATLDVNGQANHQWRAADQRVHHLERHGRHRARLPEHARGAGQQQHHLGLRPGQGRPPQCQLVDRPQQLRHGDFHPGRQLRGTAAGRHHARGPGRRCWPRTRRS